MPREQLGLLLFPELLGGPLGALEGDLSLMATRPGLGETSPSWPRVTAWCPMAQPRGPPNLEVKDQE